jgi:putative oxidoreductase
MATTTFDRRDYDIDTWLKTNATAVMPAVVLSGRVLFSLIFILSAFGHFSRDMVGYAASQGVPLASFLVPFSGFMALLGGLSILLGYQARVGALLLIFFLIPVTFTMHNFWAIGDPEVAQIQQAMFMKNLSMLGGALMILYFGSGPLSLKRD